MQGLIVLFMLGISVPSPFKKARELQTNQYLYQKYEIINNQSANPWTWTFVGPEGGDILWVVSHRNSSGAALAYQSRMCGARQTAGRIGSLCYPNAGLREE